MIKNTKGITLVALVVTIVVLLILASVTIGMTLVNNGIFDKAKNATATYKQAALNESSLLNGVDEQIEYKVKGINSEVGKYKDTQAVLSATQNTAIKDDGGNTITVPIGFKIASDSATKQEDGIVIEDKDGNQFVWIPVANISNYTRTDFGASFDNGAYSGYSETMPSDEQTSVSTYHGYYIGRYEAGDKESTDNKTMRSSSIVTNTVTIKKSQAPYNFVTKAQAQTLATAMKTVEGYSGKTKLCSSYAWDTALKFIQNKVSGYATNSSQGNYSDTTFTYTDLAGTSQTKTTSTSVLLPTGQSLPACNIYDMGGNEWEVTSETFPSDPTYTVSARGGKFNISCAGYPAGYRYHQLTTYSSNSAGFRVALYM